MPDVNIINNREFAYKFLQLHDQVTLSTDMAIKLLKECHRYQFDERDEWLLSETGLVCEEGTTFRVVYPDRFTYAMLRYS